MALDYKDIEIRKPEFVANTQFFYFTFTIEMIIIGPTYKVDLNTHSIRLGRIYFYWTLLIRCFVLTHSPMELWN